MAAALFIGNARSPEFATALAALSEAFEVTTRQNIAAAGESPCPVDDVEFFGVELIVLAQSRPGEFAAAEVDRLRRRYPSAAVASLLGSWCEGETRSGKPLATASRLYWHQAANRLQRDIMRRAAGLAPLWSLPATCTDEERVQHFKAAPARLAAKGRSDDEETSCRTVALFGQERSSVAWLVDVCRACGYDSLWMGPRHAAEPRGVVAAIWDLTTWTSAADDELQHITRIVPAQRVVALLGFPRWHDLQRAAQRGLGAIVSKPLLLGDLYSAVGRIAKTATEGATA